MSSQRRLRLVDFSQVLVFVFTTVTKYFSMHIVNSTPKYNIGELGRDEQETGMQVIALHFLGSIITS